MKTNIHTSGPWFRTVSQDNEETIYEICTAAENGEPKEIIARVNHCVMAQGFAISEAEVRANARLIAAAPDLLAALQAVLSTYRTFRNVPKDLQEWTCIDDEAFEQGLSAIAKAKGDE